VISGEPGLDRRQSDWAIDEWDEVGEVPAVEPMPRQSRLVKWTVWGLMVLATTTVLLVHVDAIVPLIAVIAVQSLFVQLYFGPLFAVPIEFLGARSAGLTSGFGNFFANVGGFTFAYTLGALKDATGSFAVGLYSLSAMCLIGLVCTVALGRMRPAAVAAPETASA